MRYPAGVASDRDEDLGRTATAPANPSRAPEDLAEPVGATLGRYRLERELGSGGMGVVHAAFDPVLERRIALKVLRVSVPTLEARDRLMREARAMARLAHPNVVTVHEVGTANGRDFVAMELIQGDNLADWVRASRRPAAAIVDAFVAAGRGLAAAHAAGIVHRDFKPHNVLRGRDGRIVVTDFGLAREAEGPLPAALEMTLPVGTQVTEATGSPSSLAGITVTGALLGTPAYMAPEQWRGGGVTPATDQFAYCVALWEALAGARPYPGPTLDDLRTQVARGPAALDASRIPRRLRGVLRRGLDPVPAQRWPSMDALLARLVRAERRPGVAIAIAGGALAGAAALIVALRSGSAPAPVCEPPARDVTAVWSPAIAADLRARTSDAHAAVLEAAYRGWQAARATACAAPPQVKQAQLACLDGVLGRFDLVRQAYARVPTALAEDLQAELVDPEICRKPAVADVPRLTIAAAPDVVAAYELLGRSETDAKPSDVEIAGLIGKANAAPCARVIATLAFEAASKDVPRARSLMADAVSVVDQCGDERLRADLLIRSIPYHWELPMIGPRGEAAMKQAQVAAERVMQPDVAATIAMQGVFVAQQRGRWDEAFRLVETAIAGYGARGLRSRQLGAVIRRNGLRTTRAEPDDLKAAVLDAQTWRPAVAASHNQKQLTELDRTAAWARYRSGDVAAAHTELLRLYRAEPAPEPTAESRTVRGEVVDARGRPVPGATVAAGNPVLADSVGIDLPLSGDEARPQFAITDDAGRFVITGAAQTGAVVAQLADRRSLPSLIADHVRLVLEPTRSVSGKVDLGGRSPTRVGVACEPVADRSGRFFTIAPVAADGSFSVAGVTVGAVRIGVSLQDAGTMGAHNEFPLVRPAGAAALTGILLAVTSSDRAIDVYVRSAVATKLDAAQVILLTGKLQIRNAEDLMRLQTAGTQMYFAEPIADSGAAPAMPDKVRRDDLVAHVQHAPAGELTACAIALTGDMLDPVARQRLIASVSKLTLRCEPIGPAATSVIVAVPPQQRLD